MKHYYIGWDVGGWNCDNNSRSRDAIVILDGKRSIAGMPWRGNLRVTINEATDTFDWLEGLFGLCNVEAPSRPLSATVGIDAPLGFSKDFMNLLIGQKPATHIGDSETNSYLFRETERFLLRNGIKPLSAVKDMIGSQATKAMHVLARFIPEYAGCGVWKGQDTLTAIEAYPSPCRRSKTIIALLRNGYPPLKHGDEEDALICALVAYLFSQQREQLREPLDGTPAEEGWIWLPSDALS